ncbi:MAG: hypothetical protein WC027_03285 [Candidatus Paceibacterota bacterium]
MKKLNFEKVFKNIKQPTRSIERDWKIMVLIFAVGLISLSIFAWQIYLSDKIGGGYLSPTITAPETNTKTVDKKRLQADIMIFETRADEYQKLKTSPKVVDPSL